MSLCKLAFSNFRRSIREYAALVLSLAFSVFIFFSFQNVIYADSMDVLQSMNKDYIDLVIRAALLVFGVFLFFFIWYATNIFLKQRKKEIGIYTFMGLDNRRIGRLYALEATWIGLVSLAAGLLCGVVFSKLFQMLFLRLSDIHVDVKFSFSLKPVLITSVLFVLCFGLMILKGYISIIRSSVLALLSGANQAELKKKNPVLSALKTIFGILVLLTGFGCSMKAGGIETLVYALAATVLVILGTYLLFGGAIPALAEAMTGKKRFLYKKERVLWVNNLSFRIRQNYRTYAMVTIIMISAVTVLGMAMAMRQRYTNLVHFRETYTYQVVSTGNALDDQTIRAGIEETNEIVYGTEISCLLFPDSENTTGLTGYHADGVVACSQVEAAARAAGLAFSYGDLKDQEAVLLNHVMLMSLAGSAKGETVSIGGRDYTIAAEDSTAYLGDLQRMAEIYLVSDAAYRTLKSLGEETHLFNYKIADSTNVDASLPYLHSLASQQDGQFRVGVNHVAANRDDEAWIRVFYSLCVFLFLTLILAGMSILFIKLNNDARQDGQRYQVLQKLGISRSCLCAAMKQEIRFAYFCPFLLMVISSVFSIHALSMVMKENLVSVNVYSACTVLILFTLAYHISVKGFRRRVLEENEKSF